MNDTDINPLVQHTSNILALAMEKHAGAINAVQRRPFDFAAAQRAADDLADAELLVEDAVDLTGDEQLAGALAQLRLQRAILDQSLAQMPTIPLAPSPWGSPWPWISLAAFALSLVTIVI